MESKYLNKLILVSLLPLLLISCGEKYNSNLLVYHDDDLLGVKDINGNNVLSPSSYEAIYYNEREITMSKDNQAFNYRNNKENKIDGFELVYPSNGQFCIGEKGDNLYLLDDNYSKIIETSFLNNKSALTDSYALLKEDEDSYSFVNQKGIVNKINTGDLYFANTINMNGDDKYVIFKGDIQSQYADVFGELDDFKFNTYATVKTDNFSLMMLFDTINNKTKIVDAKTNKKMVFDDQYLSYYSVSNTNFVLCSTDEIITLNKDLKLLSTIKTNNIAPAFGKDDITYVAKINDGVYKTKGTTETKIISLNENEEVNFANNSRICINNFKKEASNIYDLTVA